MTHQKVNGPGGIIFNLLRGFAASREFPFRPDCIVPAQASVRRLFLRLPAFFAVNPPRRRDLFAGRPGKRQIPQHRMRRLAVLLLVTGALATRAATPVDFDHDIVPILRQHCAECHTGDKKKGGLSFNTRESLLRGGEDGPVVKPGDATGSLLLKAILSRDPDEQMPPKGDRLTEAEVAKVRAWIGGGVVWTDGFAFKKPAYEPALRPRRPQLPPTRGGRTNGIDRILDAQLATQHRTRPAPVDDSTFCRRVHLDLVGLLPEPDALDTFLHDRRADKRTRLVHRLLTNDIAYAEQWLSFWNDLLRNDYAGTGYIDDGRRQISSWLYRALLDNKRYDQFARELIAPTADSEGFSRGIRWRGVVSAGQAVPVQFAQSVGQAFLGINLKCASCHDSFIDRWTLKESYGLAAIYADEPMELYRCDKPTGTMATPGWLFPELGQVDPSKPSAERLRQLAGLLTNPENGRFSRTIVNRFWHRLMGRGIVHPTDAMQTAPWNSDLLDYLAVHFADHGYDLKATLELICTSAAYQSRTELLRPGQDDKGYNYAGPRAKRLTAEEFLDALWQITDTAPARYDAPVVRGHLDPTAKAAAQWVWAPVTNGSLPAAGETVTLRRVFSLPSQPTTAGAAVTVDNSYTLYVNGRKLRSDDNWETVEFIDLSTALHPGINEVVLRAKNGGDAPNPAAAYFEARWRLPDGHTGSIGTDGTWSWTHAKPNDEGRVEDAGADWQPAAVLDSATWRDRTAAGISTALAQALLAERPRVRVSLLKSDLLQRTLGRPNREQIVSVRPSDLSTLEAMDLSNGPLLSNRLAEGAKHLAERPWASSDALIDWLYRSALSRSPAKSELELARKALGEKPDAEGIEDLLWVVCLLPEFQMVR